MNSRSLGASLKPSVCFSQAVRVQMHAYKILTMGVLGTESKGKRKGDKSSELECEVIRTSSCLTMLDKQ